MADAIKPCPICGATNHHNAVVCHTCGAALTHIEPVEERTPRTAATFNPQDHDFRYGENDLLEQSISRTARLFLTAAVGVVMLFFAGVGLIAIQQGFFASGPDIPGQESQTILTEQPTLFVATVTQGPPTRTNTPTPPPTFTPSITPTPAPCVYRMPSGGALSWALTNCGHQTLDVMPTVLALNGLSDAASVQAGQEIIVPWPTATVDPNATPTPTLEVNNENGDTRVVSLFEVDESIDAFAPTATPTLPPGVMWHRVQRGEYISTIVTRYNADVKVLSELNPQVDFARCEFGDRFGGPDCIVQLIEGQMLRVPAPTPTPTLSPTPDPNATSTPLPTATYNEPRAVSPEDRAVFMADEIITIRWVPTGTLNPGQAYRVDVYDDTVDAHYVGYTTDVFFIVPQDWRGNQALRHNYRWTVSIIDQDTPEQITFQTPERIFAWQGVQEGDS